MPPANTREKQQKNDQTPDIIDDGASPAKKLFTDRAEKKNSVGMAIKVLPSGRAMAARHMQKTGSSIQSSKQSQLWGSLTAPCTTRGVRGDGDCMFCTISHMISGTEEQHMSVRAAVCSHMLNNSPLLLDKHIRGYTSMEEYITKTDMNKDGTWGTLLELLTVAHLLQANVYNWNVQQRNWYEFGHSIVQAVTCDNTPRKSIYLRHTGNHYDVVIATETPLYNKLYRRYWCWSEHAYS